MKKVVLGVSMILACLIFLVPPATAASVSHSGAPELSAFLASLTGPAPVTAAKRPAIRQKSLCVVGATCAGGGSVSCSGNNSSTSCSGVDGNCAWGEPGHVTCDGVTTWCPNTCFNCGTLEQQCAWGCNPCNYSFSCDPETQSWDCSCIYQSCPQ